MKIEKGIPISPDKRDNKAMKLYPFDEMSVGDSIFINEENGNIKSSRGVASRYGKKTGKVFTTRTVDGGLRIWRVE